MNGSPRVVNEYIMAKGVTNDCSSIDREIL